jgi:hypothetical protein
MYPIIPKSNSKLEAGQFWPIKLSNGKYAIGVILDFPDKKVNTKHFYVGLLNWVGDNIPTQMELEQTDLKLVDQGKAHIKTITFDGQKIVGKINLDAVNISPAFEVSCFGYSENTLLLQGYQVIRKSTPEDHKTYNTQGGWGYDYINKLAERKLSKEPNTR